MDKYVNLLFYPKLVRERLCQKKSLRLRNGSVLQCKRSGDKFTGCQTLKIKPLRDDGGELRPNIQTLDTAFASHKVHFGDFTTTIC